jgi:hypothetical protein
VLLRKEEGDDAGPGAWFEDTVLWLDAAEISEQNAVEGEPVAGDGLGDGNDTGAAEGDAVRGNG